MTTTTRCPIESPWDRIRLIVCNAWGHRPRVQHGRYIAIESPVLRRLVQVGIGMETVMLHTGPRAGRHHEPVGWGIYHSGRVRCRRRGKYNDNTKCLWHDLHFPFASGGRCGPPWLCSTLNRLCVSRCASGRCWPLRDRDYRSSLRAPGGRLSPPHASAAAVPYRPNRTARWLAGSYLCRVVGRARGPVGRCPVPLGRGLESVITAGGGRKCGTS